LIKTSLLNLKFGVVKTLILEIEEDSNASFSIFNFGASRNREKHDTIVKKIAASVRDSAVCCPEGSAAIQKQHSLL
jgi:hypothetical protein